MTPSSTPETSKTKADAASLGVDATARPAPAMPAPAAAPAKRDRSIMARLYEEGFAFDFFQSVRILEKLQPDRNTIGRGFPPSSEIARFRALISLNFPPSSIYDIAKPAGNLAMPTMIVSFMGLTGPSGMLPRHYTELLMRLEREGKGPEKFALRDFIDLFNHRFISLFYRAWEKYRFFVPYERGEYNRPEPDSFTQCLYSLVGQGMAPLRNRMRVAYWEDEDGHKTEHVLTRVDDLALLHYSGFLSHRPRCAISLQALLCDYFQLSAEVLQFQGQWLVLEPENQTQMGLGNSELGVNAVAGERVWDVQSKIRIRVGPLHFPSFSEFLPDRSPIAQQKAFFILSHLVRMYVGPEFDFEVQLILKAEEVPECQLIDHGPMRPRLGWNTWIRTEAFPRDADEAVFAGEELIWLNEDQRPMPLSA